MRNKDIWIIVVVILFIIIGCILSVDKYSEVTCKKEVHRIANLELTENNFDTNTKSLLGYGKIEEALKIYLKTYSHDIDVINNVSNDETLKNILSIDNISKDGKKFKESLPYLEDSIKKYTNAIDELITMSDEKYLNNFIKDYTDSDKCISLYQELVKEEKIADKFYNIDELNNNKSMILNNLNLSVEALTYLKNNQDGWNIEDGIIKFNSYELLNGYNEIINKITK